jgi:predicted Rossmann fold nucleotide-binding protein DprA/Smf involved in DNA uptake
MRNYSYINLPEDINRWYLSGFKRKVDVLTQIELFSTRRNMYNKSSIVSEGCLIIERDSQFWPYTINENYFCPPYLFIYGNPKLLYTQNILKIGVTGSRSCDSKTEMIVRKYIERINSIDCISPLYIIGGARGVDSIVLESVVKEGVGIVVVLPKITDRYKELVSQFKTVSCIALYPECVRVEGKMFLERNWAIASLSNNLLFMKGGLRSGTMSCSNYAVKLGKEVYVNDCFEAGSEGYSGNMHLLGLGYNSISKYIKKLANYGGGV